MIIMVNARNLGIRPSGVGIYAYNFIKSLSEYSNYEIHVVVDIVKSKQIKDLVGKRNITIHEYGKEVRRSFNVFFYYMYIREIINDVQPDFFWETNNVMPINMKNPYGKIIVTVHDVIPLVAPEIQGRLYSMYFKHALRKTIRNTDEIFYISNQTKIQLERMMPVVRDKKYYISSVIVPYNKQEVEIEPCDERVFLYLGNLEYRKGLDILLNAFNIYTENVGQGRLVIAGKIQEDRVRSLLDKAIKKNSDIEYVGYVDEIKKYKLLEECDCLLFPSRGEGFGIPIIEALQHGKNVIASNLDVFCEIAGDEIDMFSIDSGADAYKKLANELIKYTPRYVDSAKYRKMYSTEVLGNKLIKHIIK